MPTPDGDIQTVNYDYCTCIILYTRQGRTTGAIFGTNKTVVSIGDLNGRVVIIGGFAAYINQVEVIYANGGVASIVAGPFRRTVPIGKTGVASYDATYEANEAVVDAAKLRVQSAKDLLKENRTRLDQLKEKGSPEDKLKGLQADLDRVAIHFGAPSGDDFDLEKLQQKVVDAIDKHTGDVEADRAEFDRWCAAVRLEPTTYDVDSVRRVTRHTNDFVDDLKRQAARKEQDEQNTLREYNLLLASIRRQGLFFFGEENQDPNDVISDMLAYMANNQVDKTYGILGGRQRFVDDCIARARKARAAADALPEIPSYSFPSELEAQVTAQRSKLDQLNLSCKVEKETLNAEITILEEDIA